MKSRAGICDQASLLVLTIAAIFLASGCSGGDAVSEGAYVQCTPAGLVVTDLAVEGDRIEVARADGTGTSSQVPFVRRGGALIVDYSWEAGVEYRLWGNGDSVLFTAPVSPMPALVTRIDLSTRFSPAAHDDVAATAAALSGDGLLAAAGSSTGDLVIHNFESWKSWDVRLPGSYLRSMVFSDDMVAKVLFTGEQSPAGSIRAWRITDKGAHELWRRDTQHEIGAGRADPDDPFAWAHQPGIYRLMAAEDGLLALATHSVVTRGNEFNASTLYHLAAEDGSIRWRWPADGYFAGVATWFDRSDDGTHIVICAYTSDGRGHLIVVDGADGRELRRFDLDPLAPHVRSVSFWKSVAIAPDGGAAYLIASDGRAWIVPLPGGAMSEQVLGEPIPAGDVTILISGGGVLAHADGATFITGVSYLPWEQSAGERPPQPHPSANLALAFSSKGERGASVRLSNLTQGAAADAAGRWLFIAGSSDPTYSPGAGSGLTIIDRADGMRVAAGYALEGAAANVDPSVGRNGLVLLLETVQRDAAGTRLIGRNALHLLRW